MNDEHIDPELRAIAAIINSIQTLDPVARRRVMLYAYRRYCEDTERQGQAT
jgi:hypothetical protein